jgi:hypothetical protein
VSSRRIVSAYEIYLSERGIHCTKIPEALTKTPDYELVCDERRYLNELKSPSLNLDPITGMYRFSTTHSKILKNIHDSIGQFNSFDPDHDLPWIVCAFR